MNSAALVQSWSVVVRVDFVCLTRRAPFDVFFYVLLQIWPPVVLLQQRCCVADSGVSAIRWVVKGGNYPPRNVVVVFLSGVVVWSSGEGVCSCVFVSCHVLEYEIVLLQLLEFARNSSTNFSRLLPVQEV